MKKKIFKQGEKIIPKKYKWILNHKGFKKYLSNTSWMFCGQGLSLLVSFFIGTWVARYLGPNNYGILSYTVAFVGLFAFISDLGSKEILTRELVKFPEKRDQLMGTVFRLKLIGGCIAMTLVIITSFIIKMDSLARFLIIIFSFSFILQTINIINTYFQAKVKAKKNVRVTSIAILISALLKIAVILLGKGIIYLIIIYLLDIVWQGIGYVITYHSQNLKIKTWRFNNHLAKTIWKSSWPLMLATAASCMYSRIDQVMIGSILNNLEVGLYAAGVKLAEVWYFIPGMIATSLFPAIINAKKTGKKIYEQRLKNFYILMLIISFLIIIMTTILAHPLVNLLFGAEYLASISVLKIYIWSNLGLFLWMALNKHLMTEDKVKTIFIVNLCAMIINIILNIILIPILGIQGAAWATVISYLSLPLGTWLINKKL